MGTIASVLQWCCTNCNVINPTESLKCMNCGTWRKVFPSPTSTIYGSRNPWENVCLTTNNEHRTQSPIGVDATDAFTNDADFNKSSQHPNEDKYNDEINDDSGPTITRNENTKRVYKSLLRGCLKRPQRNHQNLPANCVDCEDTRKYVKNSIELYHHFSNPSLNRRWICNECDSENNSVTWHCVICDTVSYLAPIYKETLVNRKQNYTKYRNTNQQQTIDGIQYTENFKSKRYIKKSNYFRRTQSLTTDKSFSCRSCHICFVNNRKDIFNLPDTFMHKYNRGTALNEILDRMYHHYRHHHHHHQRHRIV